MVSILSICTFSNTRYEWNLPFSSILLISPVVLICCHIERTTFGTDLKLQTYYSFAISEIK